MSESRGPVTIFGPDFPFAYDDWGALGRIDRGD
jgi:hypothetical protein